MRASLLALALAAGAVPQVQAGSLVDVAVEVAGETVPLYGAVDGSGRLYFEAREGCVYALTLSNRSHERLGALVVVDGLNAISGEREEIGRGRPGRLYVLAPWAQVEVRGWRTSLDQVRQFTFVDERSSYAARAGKANSRMGWVEVAIYRDRTPAHVGGWRREAPLSGARDDESRDRPAGEARGAEEPSAKADGSKRSEGGVAASRPAPAAGYPGTGWGEAAWDPATEVRFVAAGAPAERITLRYEYAPALQALGILPRPWWGRDRLRERDRGEGFAKPPRW
jgi:hypothetical protein